MFTVIITGRNATNQLKNYRYLFKPFLNDGSLAFCSWNESGTDIRTSVPELYGLIKGKTEWRAVIVTTDSIDGFKECVKPSEDNPFDFGNDDCDVFPHESSVPLVRLTHMIGGYKTGDKRKFKKAYEYTDYTGETIRVTEEELAAEALSNLSKQYEVKTVWVSVGTPDDFHDTLGDADNSAFETAYEYIDSETNERIRVKKRSLTTEEISALSENPTTRPVWISPTDPRESGETSDSAAADRSFEKAYECSDSSNKTIWVKESDLAGMTMSGMSENFEIKQVWLSLDPPDEITEAIKTLEDRYHFSDVLPSEIDCISTTEKTIENSKRTVRKSWENHLELTSSGFWERNNYPNNCRFLYAPVAEQESSLFYRDITKFWLSVLTFATNKVNASSLQAYRLYKIGIDIDNAGLSQVLNDHLNKMKSAYAFVRDTLSINPDLSFDEDEEILTRQKVPVVSDNMSTRDLFVDFSGIGLSKDCPRSEENFWNETVINKKKALRVFLKTPRRSIDKASNYLRRRSEEFRDSEYVLDRFQTEDLEEELDNLEREILSSGYTSCPGYKEICEKLNEADKKAKKDIAFRMSKKTVLITGIVILAIIFGGFIPYIVTMIKTDLAKAGIGLLVILAVLAVCSLAGILSLVYMKRKHMRVLKLFNDEMRSASKEVAGYENRFENYFTNICTYMKGRSILDGVRLANKNSHCSAHNYHLHKSALAYAMDRDKEWLRAFSIARKEEIVPNVTTFFNPEKAPAENSLYYFNPDVEMDYFIPVNDTGDQIKAPYRFIAKLWIDREEIFDDKGGPEY